MAMAATPRRGTNRERRWTIKFSQAYDLPFRFKFPITFSFLSHPKVSAFTGPLLIPWLLLDACINIPRYWIRDELCLKLVELSNYSYLRQTALQNTSHAFASIIQEQAPHSHRGTRVPNGVLSKIRQFTNPVHLLFY
jgi:hypothetical protein